jgi:hypothetical protein
MDLVTDDNLTPVVSRNNYPEEISKAYHFLKKGDYTGRTRLP